MQTPTLYSGIFFGSLFMVLAGCGGDDTQPVDTAQTVQAPATTPASQQPSDTTPAQNTQQQTNIAQRDEEQEDAPVLDVEEAELIPEDYTRDGGQIARLAVADIQPTEGNQTSGTVVFIQGDAEDEEIRVIGKLNDIEPGTHGFHIHEIGNCSAPDASSAGDHYNPAGNQHADRASAVRHVGDLGNLVADADRTASFDFMDSGIALQGPNSVIEKAFIVHAMEDDLTSQPSGNSGDRIACGVIDRRNALGIPE